MLPDPSSTAAGGPRTGLLVALGVVVAAVGTVVALVVGGGGGDGAVTSATTTTAPTTTTTEAAPRPDEAPEDPHELLEVIAELSGFVEAERGLPFLEDVEVELLDDDEFRARLLEDALADREELAATQSLLRALELVEDDVDLEEVLLSFLGDAVLGFYDPETGELVVRGSDLTPYVRSTLVHELTHALDDQHFDLDRPELDDRDDEAGFAFLSLVEGSAVRVEQAWAATLSEDEQRRLRSEELRLGASIDLASIPPIVPQLVAFPYVYGPTFVDALVEEGGTDLLDAAFDDPPTTSAQIIDPDLYLAGIDARAVPDPPAGGPVVDQGAFGLWSLLVTLEAKLPRQAVGPAAAGWVGDRYVVWEEGTRTCVRAAFATDDGGDALLEAWQAWAADHTDATAERTDDLIQITACG
jgi:hypothetical protein